MRNDGYNFHYSSLIKSITRYRSTYFIRVFFAREQSSCCVLFAWWHHKLFIWIECLTFIKHKAFTPHSIGSSPPPITRSPFNLLFQVSYFIHVDVHLYSLPAFKKSILHPFSRSVGWEVVNRLSECHASLSYSIILITSFLHWLAWWENSLWHTHPVLARMKNNASPLSYSWVLWMDG